MNHALVTGAAGFVGQALVSRLLSQGIQRLTAVDQRFDREAITWLSDPRVRAVEGNLGDLNLLESLLADPVSHVFHLASVPGALAEREAALGAATNLTAPIALLLALARRHVGLAPPSVVFASSIAVYGSLPPDVPVTEDTPVAPVLSYGAHKVMIELLLADLSRRGELDGVSLRLPGIVARPPAPTGHGSAFMSDLIRRGRAGQPYVCPVGPQARCWWMSLPTCVANLMHAAFIDGASLPGNRVVQLPVLTASVSEVAQAIASEVPEAIERLTWRPDPNIERVFGSMPPLLTPGARKIGFVDDGSISSLLDLSLRGW